MPPITYQLEPGLTADEFIDLLVRSTLAERRPVHDREVIHGMLQKADVIVTARLDDLLVGVSRAISDFAYCTYLSDLAVEERQQRQGIGSRDRTGADNAHSRSGGSAHVAFPTGSAESAHLLPTHRHDSTRFLLDDPR